MQLASCVAVFFTDKDLSTILGLHIRSLAREHESLDVYDLSLISSSRDFIYISVQMSMISHSV